MDAPWGEGLGDLERMRSARPRPWFGGWRFCCLCCRAADLVSRGVDIGGGTEWRKKEGEGSGGA